MTDIELMDSDVYDYDTILKRRKDEYKYLEIQKSGVEKVGQLLYDLYRNAFVITNIIRPSVIEVFEWIDSIEPLGNRQWALVTDEIMEYRKKLYRSLGIILKRKGNCYKVATLNDKGNYVIKSGRWLMVCYKETYPQPKIN